MKHDIADPHIVYELSVGEGEEKAELIIDLRKLSAFGITEDEVPLVADDLSRQILENLLVRQYVDNSGLIHLIIG